MPKKPISRKPKPISRKPKTKSKNGVNVNINIDNSKKTTARRNAIKPSNMQPFVNFPSYQPTRIQQLEPKLQFNSPDFTKTMDEYQKQFKTYLETNDKTVKDMIEKYDDTLKKNVAPQKKEESKPGASNVYATDGGETILEEPMAIKKTSMKTSEPTQTQKQNITHIKDDSNLKVGYSGWGRSNEFQGNPLTLMTTQLPQANQTIVKAEAIDEKKLIDNAIKNATDPEELKKNAKRAEARAVELNKVNSYNNYLAAHKKFYGPDDDTYIDIKSDKGQSYNSANWSTKAKGLNNSIEKYGTFEKQKEQEAYDEIKKEYDRYVKTYAQYHLYGPKEDMYDYKEELLPANFWVKKTALLEEMIKEKKKRQEEVMIEDKSIKKKELGLMGIEDKLTKTFDKQLIKQQREEELQKLKLAKDIENERIKASKANIKRVESIPGPNVKKKVVALETNTINKSK